MAESSSSSSTTTTTNNNGSSPILCLSEDHIFTILLLLPIDSIISFALTCKRFMSLSLSNTLWESICSRDLGSTSVEALKSSVTNQQLPWLRLYKQVSEFDSLSCYKLCDPDSALVYPNPRASHSLNFLSDCLILFGGGCEGGRHLDDSWVAYIGSDLPRMLRWERVGSGIPSGRFGHTCVVVGDYLLLFGGINDRGDRQNDTWVGQVTFGEDLGISFSWRLLDVGSVAPPPRGAHAACCVDKVKMVIHGGIGLYGLRLGDTWVLELSENLCFGTWHEIVTNPSPPPPPRSGHSITCITESEIILFGGRGSGYEVLNDVWLLLICDSQSQWLPMLYELQNVPGGVLLPRVGHSATLILGGRLLIYGGEDSYRHRKDDLWVLDTRAIQSNKNQLIPKELQTNLWKRPKVNGYRLNGRSFHRACADRTGRYLYVFGGMVDGALQPADASGLRFDGELFILDLLPWL